MSAYLSLRSIVKAYGAKRALDDVSLDVPDGEILAILGPSGSGKSTLLRLVAGLEAPDQGEILFQHHDLKGVPPHRRGFGLMFQDYALFPHLSVSGNVGFGLRMKGWSRDRKLARIEELLRLVHLEGFGRRDVLSLSGGEQQRVALARALAPSPRLLMLDEPLGALDATLRRGLLDELRAILGAVGLAVLYVTHDHEEALGVAQRVALLREGRLVQLASPADLVASPSNVFVASFLKLGAIVPARLLSRTNGTWRVATGLGEFSVAWGHAPPAEPTSLLIRPSAVSFCERVGARKVAARLISRMPQPGGTLARIALSGEGGLAVGQGVAVRHGPEGAEVECLVPPDRLDGQERPRLPGGALNDDLRAVWIHPAGCELLPSA